MVGGAVEQLMECTRCCWMQEETTLRSHFSRRRADWLPGWNGVNISLDTVGWLVGWLSRRHIRWVHVSPRPQLDGCLRLLIRLSNYESYFSVSSRQKGRKLTVRLFNVLTHWLPLFFHTFCLFFPKTFLIVVIVLPLQSRIFWLTAAMPYFFFFFFKSVLKFPCINILPFRKKSLVINLLVSVTFVLAWWLFQHPQNNEQNGLTTTPVYGQEALTRGVEWMDLLQPVIWLSLLLPQYSSD